MSAWRHCQSRRETVIRGCLKFALVLFTEAAPVASLVYLTVTYTTFYVQAALPWSVPQLAQQCQPLPLERIRVLWSGKKKDRVRSQTFKIYGYPYICTPLPFRVKRKLRASGKRGSASLATVFLFGRNKCNLKQRTPESIYSCPGASMKIYVFTPRT